MDKPINDIKFGIITPTYQKLDGTTHDELKRALESVKEQTYENYKVYLIGDDYEDNEELIKLSKIIDPEKIYVENLPEAVERKKYKGRQLWVCAGTNASNIAIEYALKDECDFICFLDHDDYYKCNHLKVLFETIKKFNTHFVTTKCGTYPKIDNPKTYNLYRPLHSRIFKISTCIDLNHYDFRFRNMVEDEKNTFPGDADLWVRVNKEMTKNDEFGYFVNIETCVHKNEGTTWKKPEVVKKL